MLLTVSHRCGSDRFCQQHPGLDTINFNIPGSGVKTIAPASPLPTITDAVVIDGYSQPGASANTRSRPATTPCC
jgi:hypothetical protein